MNESLWWEFLSQHWRKIIGGLVGFLFAFIFIKFGILKGFFIILCIVTGVLIGWRLDLGEGIKGLFTIFKSPKE